MARTTKQLKVKRRKARQRKPARAMKRREDRQLDGTEPTVPVGAAWSEVVNPATQGEQPLPRLISQAIRNGWATPDEMKPILVDEMMQVILDPEIKPMVKTFAYQALLKGDQAQYERDNPEAAGKAKGGVKVDVNQQVAILADPWQLYQRALEESERDPVEEQIAAVLEGKEAQHDEQRADDESTQLPPAAPST